MSPHQASMRELAGVGEAAADARPGGAEVRSLRRALYGALWCRWMMRAMVGYLAVAAVVLLGWRSLGGSLSFSAEVAPAWFSWSAGVWWLAGLVVGGLALAAAGAWWVRRGVFSEATARSLLDARGGFGGLLMAEGAAGAEVWSARSAATWGTWPGLRVRWSAGGTAGALAFAGLFLIGAVAVPMPDSVLAGVLRVDRPLSSLREQIAVLKEESVIDEAKADALEADAAKVAEEARADDPVRTWEALDHLAAQLQREGAEAQEQARRSASEALAASALAEAVAMGQGQLSEAQLGGAAEALAELTEAALNGPLPTWLNEALSLPGGAGLDPSTLEKLRALMEGREAELAEMLEALQAAGLCEGGLGPPGEFDPEALKEWLAKQGEGQCQGSLIAGACRGGITRGPGHAELTWKDPSSKEGASFDPEVLPPSAWRDPTQSRRLGVSRTAPQVDGEAAGSSGGALGGVTSDGGAATATRVLPRHRATVQQYFDRTEEANPGANPP